MRKYLVASIVVLPLLLSFSHATQSWPVDPPDQITVFSSEESGTSSYLGVDISDVSTERLSALKLKEEKGVEVTMVDQDAPAGKAGIKEHDVIVSMNGTAIESGAQLRRMIHETPAGRVVEFGLSRDGQPLTIKVQLGDRHKEFSSAPKDKDFHFSMPPMPNLPDFDVPQVNVVVVHSSARSGLMVENLTPQLGEFFGVKNGKGVLVRSVEKGSRAEKAGFRAGDVIVKVNDQPVQDTSDFSHAIRSTTTDSVTIGVVRDKHEQNLTLSLPPHKTSGDVWEESFDDSDFNAESFVDLGELRDEWAQMQPQMQFAIDESRHALEQVKPEIDKAKREAVEEIERAKPEIERALREAQAATERAQQELCSQHKELRRQTEKLKKEIQKQQRSLMQENRKQMERLRHEMRGEWTQI